MRVVIASLTLVALVAWAEPDGGTPDAGAAEQLTFGHLRQLATEYGCPPAPPPEVLDGGVEILTPDRVDRNACIETRAVTEVFKWRELADAGTVSPPPNNASIYITSAIICAVSGAFTAYANNRTARHLQLWPP